MGLTHLDDKITLPFLSRLGINDPMTVTDEDVQKIATSFIKRFSDAISANDVDSVATLFYSECLWRDLLALTWDFNTIFKVENVRNMLKARLEKVQISNLRLSKNRDMLPTKFNPSPILFMINIPFEFDTAAGSCTGIARLIPVPFENEVEWKVYTLFTNLDQIKGCPDKVGQNRRLALGNYLEQREKEVAFENEDPLVIIVGSGHAGCDVGARLKAKDIPYLIIERNPRVGGNWRNRYDCLTLFDFSCESFLLVMTF